MMLLDDNKKLIGLIVNLLPFTYENNTITADVSLYLEIDELITKKEELMATADNEFLTDNELLDIRNTIYFIDCILEKLEVTLQDGHNL